MALYRYIPGRDQLLDGVRVFPQLAHDPAVLAEDAQALRRRRQFKQRDQPHAVALERVNARLVLAPTGGPRQRVQCGRSRHPGRLVEEDVTELVDQSIVAMLAGRALEPIGIAEPIVGAIDVHVAGDGVHVDLQALHVRVGEQGARDRHSSIAAGV